MHDIKTKLLALDEINNVNVETTFDPIWEPNMMTDYAKEKLGLKVRKAEDNEEWE